MVLSRLLYWHLRGVQTKDVEEKEQCERMHEIIKEHKLEGQFRWLVALKDRVFNGELYRYIAGAGQLSFRPDP